MEEINEILKMAVDLRASDVHLSVGSPAIFRINGELKFSETNILTASQTAEYVKEILSNADYEQYLANGEKDSAYEALDVGRFRVNAFKKRGNDALVLRLISLSIPSLDSLQMPAVIKKLAQKNRGLILVTGTTGSGKSTTLAAMINEINMTRQGHILTLEDPIEYLHKNNKSIISQREIGRDTKSYANGLRAALREDPDVILVGEMRDFETISTALTAAETGHLVLSTLHTMGAVKTIDRIVGVFPAEQQQQVRMQLSSVFEGVISQQLIPQHFGGRTAALEVMIATDAIRNQIREGKLHQMESTIQTGAREGMVTMDSSIMSLYKNGIISVESALRFAVNKERFSQV
ncbi:MAG: type IV pilus twitching motility protein PilT [Pelosinus sp.]|nr:type IV pilus twitching motility protein PilT [Pelosinus sp.]